VASGKVVLVMGAESPDIRAIVEALRQTDLTVNVLNGDAQSVEMAGAFDAAVIVSTPEFAKPFLETTDAEWDYYLDQNFERALWLSQSAARVMMSQGKPGSIIFVSSIAGQMPFAGMSAFGTSLGALRAMAKMAAVDLAPHGITVNVIEKGWSGVPSEFRSQLEDGTPNGRLTTASDVGNLCTFLMSEAARSITGQFLTVDGGYTLTPGEGPSPFFNG
jgi:glucose 1-dehydrogenase